MTAEELKNLLADTLKEFGDAVDAKLDALRKELTPDAPVVAGATDEDEDVAARIGEALKPLVEAVEGLSKDRGALAEAVENIVGRIEGVEKFLTGRQSDEDVEDEVTPAPAVTKTKEAGLAELTKAIHTAVRGREVRLS